MADTHGEMVAELVSHGFQSLESGKAELFVDQAALELLVERPWDWRRREIVVSPPAVVLDLGPVEQVIGADGYPLEPTKVTDIRDIYGASESSSSTGRYWRQNRTLGVFPDEDQVTVFHFTTYPWLDTSETTLKVRSTAASDVPLCPIEFRDVIVLGALKRAHVFLNDFEQAGGVADEWDRRVEQMVWADGRDQVDEQRKVRVVDGEDWA